MQPPRSLFLLLLASGLGGSWAASAQTTDKPVETKASGALRDLSTALESLTRQVGRGVVQVFSTGYTLSEEGDSSSNNLLARQRSTGSGAIVSSDGYVVTNSHVVLGGRRIQVQLADSVDQSPGHSVLRPAGKRLDAKIVGIDRDSDLAVLKIERTGLPFLQFGDSEVLRQGQIVLAF